MNAPTSFSLDTQIDRVRWWDALDLYSVVLKDGSLGIGATVGEALAKAKAPGAQNVLRRAA